MAEKKVEPRSGVYGETESGKLQDMNEIRQQQETRSNYETRIKEAEKLKEESDKKVEKLNKEFSDPEKQKEVVAQSEDTFEDIGKKLNEARKRWQEAENNAGNPDDPNIEQLRELRTKAYSQYKLLLTELIRRANLDLERR
jgi:superfamily II RNA helicase